MTTRKITKQYALKIYPCGIIFTRTKTNSIVYLIGKNTMSFIHSFIHGLLFISSHVKRRKMEIQLFYYFGHITKSVKKFVFVIL